MNIAAILKKKGSKEYYQAIDKVYNEWFGNS